MVTLRENVFLDSFFIEDKRFVVSLGRDGGVVRLLEESRRSSFSILLNRETAVWLAKVIDGSLSISPEHRLWKRFVGNGFSIIVDVLINKRASCLRILKIAQGQGRLILIPEGERRQGWRIFSRSLDAVLGRWSANQKIGDRKVEETSVNNTRPSYSEAVQGYRKKNGNEAAEQTLSVVTPDHPKTLGLAVVVRRFNGFNN